MLGSLQKEPLVTVEGVVGGAGAVMQVGRNDIHASGGKLCKDHAIGESKKA